MRILLAVVAYLATLAAVAVLAFFAALILAGPHGGLLPSAAGPLVFIIGWGTVVVVPALAARLVWRITEKHFGQRLSEPPPLTSNDIRESMTSSEETLAAGRAELDPVLVPHGFAWRAGSSGRGSGGHFASGEYVRGNRRLEIHFRVSLGMVKYHVGEMWLDHPSYMRVVLGSDGGNQYPGFSDDPIDWFRHLAHDLSHYCWTFLTGSNGQFGVIVARTEDSSHKGLP